MEQKISRLMGPDQLKKVGTASLAGTYTPVEITALACSNASETVVDEAGTKVWAYLSILERTVYKEWQQETTAKVTQQVTQKVMKQNIIAIIHTSFPSLVELTQKHLKFLNDSEQLQQRLVQIARVKDEEEAQRILLTEVTEQS